MQKLCVFCRNFWFEGGEPDWSELTPGSDMQLYCTKDKWLMSNGDTLEMFRKNILTAETCEDYTPADTDLLTPHKT